KTTCAWIHPDGDRILYASTHHDANSEQLQKAELAARESGNQRRYAWDYDPEFELYEHDLRTGKNRRLTSARGYDAEASYSPDLKTTCAWIHPDGDRILYASTHHDANSEQLQKAELAARESGNQRRYAWDYDPEFELYEHDLRTGKNRRLTSARGYDAEASYS